jgi:DNA helicase II / ATP-dependent DNA helicase PcrA
MRISDAKARDEAQRLTQLLWSLRSDNSPGRDFVIVLRAGMLDVLMAGEPSLADQREQVDRMSAALAISGPLADLDLASLGARDGSPLRLNLLTLHSAKGCEYDVVIMVGLDLGSLRVAQRTASRPTRKPTPILCWPDASAR